MARVQSILTYTLPATSDCPPPAPIRCGCHNLVLILEDRSLIRTVLQGILEVEVKSVAISSAPVSFVDVDGPPKLVWKYDYTVEYKDSDLTDPTYRVRKCDILFNCCYSCAQAYTDRQLKNYVKSVTGTHVNNSDPQNPIINNPVIVFPAVVSDSLLDVGSRVFRHTSVAGVNTDFCQGVCSITTPNDCTGGIGANFALKAASLAGGVFTLRGAPEHRAGTGSGAQTGIAYTPVPAGTTRILAQTIAVVNPSTCRAFAYQLIQEAVIELELMASAEVVIHTFNDPGREGGPSSSRIRKTVQRVGALWNTLPPGGSTNHSVYIDVELIVGVANIYGCGQSIGYIGGTI